MDEFDKFKNDIESKLSELYASVQNLVAEIEFSDEEAERLFAKSLRELEIKRNDVLGLINRLENDSENKQAIETTVNQKFKIFLKSYREFSKKFK